MDSEELAIVSRHVLAIRREGQRALRKLGEAEEEDRAVEQRPHGDAEPEFGCGKDVASVWRPAHVRKTERALVDLAVPVGLFNTPHLRDSSRINAAQHVLRVAAPLDTVDTIHAGEDLHNLECVHVTEHEPVHGGSGKKLPVGAEVDVATAVLLGFGIHHRRRLGASRRHLAAGARAPAVLQSCPLAARGGGRETRNTKP
eukprot:scaffold27712_cov110-Isochrysis_galbana.AAC.2